MKVLPKTYKLNKNKQYIKTNNLIFFFNTINVNSYDWIIIEQKLKIYKFNYYKVLNKTVIITFQKSIYCNLESSLISSLVMFIKPNLDNKNLNKKTLFSKLSVLNFIFLSMNLNNKIYSVNQIKKIYSFIYYINKLLFYKFLVTNLKFVSKKLNKSK